jgi:hypothetical protein
MTGKELKALVSQLADDDEVIIGDGRILRIVPTEQRYNPNHVEVKAR